MAIVLYAVCSDSAWPQRGTVAAIATTGSHARVWASGSTPATTASGALQAPSAGATPALGEEGSDPAPLFLPVLGCDACRTHGCYRDLRAERQYSFSLEIVGRGV